MVAYFSLSLLASSYSKAYEQRYYVGDTGPSGGVVTSVTLQSVLSDSSTELVGDFEETTYTYIYTETIVEDVQSTQQVTTTTYETVEETTGDIITNNNLSNGTVTCTTQGTGIYYDPNGCGSHTINWDDSHISTDGGYQYQTNLNEFLTQDEINYGFDVNASNSVYASTNSATWSITLKVVDPNTGYDTQTTYSWLLNQGTNNFSLGLTVDENDYSTNTILYSTFYGSDPNGYYWSLDAYNFNVSIDYYSITQVISTIEQIITTQIETALNTTEYEYDYKYIPPLDDFIYEPEIVADFSIEINTFDDVLTMDFEIVEMDTGEMQMEITTFENDMEVDVEIVELEMESSEDTLEPTNEEEPDQEVAQVKETKETIGAKIIEQVAEQGDQIALSNIKLAVMAQLTDTNEFNNYESKVILDNNVDDYLLVTIDDPYGGLFDLAQDRLMEEMVNQQYGRN